MNMADGCVCVCVCVCVCAHSEYMYMYVCTMYVHVHVRVQPWIELGRNTLNLELLVANLRTYMYVHVFDILLNLTFLLAINVRTYVVLLGTIFRGSRQSDRG